MTLNENEESNISHWFTHDDRLPTGVGDHDDQIIDGAPVNMTRYKALFVEAEEKMFDSDIYYDVNREGYRCAPFENIDYNKIQIITAGCSFTFGMGIPEGHQWPSVLAKKFPETFQVWNLGIPGLSNDAIVRTISAFCKYIKPAFIFLQWTHFNRREYVRSNNTLQRILPNHPKYHNDTSFAAKGFFGMQNEYFDLYCFEKNLMFMYYLTKAFSINFIWEEIRNFPELDITRDEHHPGIKSHKEFADIMYKKYEKNINPGM